MAQCFSAVPGVLARIFAVAGLLLGAPAVLAADGVVSSPMVAGIPVDFILFGATLLGVALFHHYVLQVALTGPGDHFAVQDHLHRVQVWYRAGRFWCPHGA